MNAEKIETLCKKLISRWKWPTDVKSSVEQWEALGLDLSKSDLIKVFSCLVDNDNVFRWLMLIGDKLPNLVSTQKEFIDLLEKIAVKVKGDMAQGPFLRSFIEIGSSSPDIGLALYDKIVQVPSLVFHAGLLLGGVGKQKFEKAFQMIRTGLQTGSPQIRAMYIRALRVIFEKEDEMVEEDKIFEILKHASDPNEDVVVRSEAANAYIDFNKFRPKECDEQLLKLAKEGDSTIRFVIANRLWIYNLENRKSEIDILKECARDENTNTLGRVASALTTKGKDYPEDALEIIKDWLMRQKYFDIGELNYCLQEIGKANLSKCMEIVGSWIETEREPVFRFHIPSVLAELSANNLEQLISYLKKWTEEKDYPFKKIIIRTISRVLLGIRHKPSEGVIDQSLNLLKEFAKDDKLQSSIESAMVEIFGRRPAFTDSNKIVGIIEDWANESNWKVRRAIITALGILARYKIDYKETVRMRIQKKTRETRIVGAEVEKVELLEGVESYKLLKKLTNDEKKEVREQAIETLKGIDKYLEEKERKINKVSTKSESGEYVI